MPTLGERVDAAIRASGKSGQEIADAIGVSPTTISRLRRGKEDNPKLQVLVGIARETGTSVGVLVGATLEMSPEDEDALQRFQVWIEQELRTVDALAEPNTDFLSAASAPVRERRVADRRNRFKTPFGMDAKLVLRAIGNSMIDAGILPDDTLYVVDHEPADALPIGKLVACRIGHDVFVKRLISDNNRHYLISAHPRYRPIELEALAFEILGVIIGRTGRVN